jgi:hypothetical protein
MSGLSRFSWTIVAAHANIQRVHNACSQQEEEIITLTYSPSEYTRACPVRAGTQKWHACHCHMMVQRCFVGAAGILGSS